MGSLRNAAMVPIGCIATSDYAGANTSTSDDSREVYAAVEWIQFFMATLSVIGSGSIIGYAVFHNVIKSPQVRPLFYLSLSDLLLALCWLIAAVLHRQKQTNTACYNLQAVGQVSDKECRIGRIVTVLSSVLPFLLIVPILSVGNIKECYRNCSFPHSCLVLNVGSPTTSDPSLYSDAACKAMHYYATAVFLLAFLVTAILILVLLGKTCALFKRYLATGSRFGDPEWAVICVTRRRALLYPVIFFCCCLPAVTLAILKLVHREETHAIYMYVLYFIQAFTAVSQGLLNCLVYGWTSRMLHYLKQTACRDVDTQTPLLRSQKKLYASTQTNAVSPTITPL
ncbi:transmembrane protein 116 isoform X2 [Ascaphus truei]|uniref:transmembrane protein 116 isoform X2 n=1 Tax=Ascaphus truei TaxID=8439 RepID=UPI003F59980B